MKIAWSIFAALFLALNFGQTSNPLRNTRWESENGIQVYFTASDTVKLSMDRKLVASALYKVKDSFLIWRDYIKSDANCDTSIRGTYVYTIKDSLLTFRVISDRCDARANVLQTMLLARD
jgi:hypothetical protein